MSTSKKPKVVRYWPGKAPEGYKTDTSSDDDEDLQEIPESFTSNKQALSEVVSSSTAAPLSEEALRTDKRIQRLRARKSTKDETDSSEEESVDEETEEKNQMQVEIQSGK
jgi:hypothetical protein